MVNPLLIFRVGYMESYDGPGAISGGGSYIKEHGEGGEMWNFLPDGGRCYGYVMTRHFGGLNLNRLAAKRFGKWKVNDELENVDIIFIAKRPGQYQAVVGWYKSATVFHKVYRKRPNPDKSAGWSKLNYLCEVNVENAVLLPKDQRTVPIPYAPTHGAGYPGHSNVWYAAEDTTHGAELMAKLRRYIGSRKVKEPLASADEAKTKRRGKWPAPPDRAMISAIEKKSMEATERHFRAAGYLVERVHTDYCGWDLTARRDNEVLQLEVKGHLGDVIHFELTPNEYEKMQEMHKTYRVCVVRHALERSTVEVYVPKYKQASLWQLRDLANKTVISLGERVAARASELK